MVNAEAIKHARIKGLILRILKDEYPHGVDVVVMRSVLAGLNYPLTEKELAGYLHYLCKARYVEAMWDKNGSRISSGGSFSEHGAQRSKNDTILWVRLDNDGLKLMDGWLIDPAVIFG